MTIKFDPMTGEPIEPDKDRQPKFDPMTGEPIVIKPDTGPKFDPMTGEPIYHDAPSQASFDSMTGQFIDPNNQAFMPEEPPKKKMKKGLVISLIAVFLVIAIAASVLALTVLQSDKAKIFSSIKKTLKDSPDLYRDIYPQNAISILESENFTLNVDGVVSDVQLLGNLRSTSKAKQLELDIRMPASYLNFDILAELDKSRLRASSSIFLDKIFTYNYKEENRGYIRNILDDEEIETLNRALAQVNETKKYKETYKKINKAILKEFGKLETSKLDKKEFTIDGKTRKCKGYGLIIKSENFENILDDIEDILKEDLEDIITPFVFDNYYYNDYDDFIEDMIDDMRYDFSYMDDFYVDFYIDKGMLAAIILEPDEYTKTQLLFEGGDSRMQNIRIDSEYDYGRGPRTISYKISGSKYGNEEKFSFALLDDGDYEAIGNLTYDTERGDIRFNDAWGDIDISLNIKNSKDSYEIRVDRFSIFDSYFYSYSPSVSGKLSIKKGSDLKEFIGTEVDLGNIDEFDLYEIFDGLENILFDIFW